MSSQLLDCGVAEGFDGCLLDCPDHPFGLAVGPWVLWLGEAMLDAIACAGAPEDLADPGLRDALIAVDELDAVVCQDGLDPVGQGPDENLEEWGCGQLGSRGRCGRRPASRCGRPRSTGSLSRLRCSVRQYRCGSSRSRRQPLVAGGRGRSPGHRWKRRQDLVHSEPNRCATSGVTPGDD